MSVEAIVLQAGEGKTLSLRGTQVAYKAVDLNALDEKASVPRGFTLSKVNDADSLAT